jgi:hypothetical protein
MEPGARVGELIVKTLLPEDLIGLKLQGMVNDPKNRKPET